MQITVTRSIATLAPATTPPSRRILQMMARLRDFYRLGIEAVGRNHSSGNWL